MDISFRDLGLDESVLNAVAAKGFEEPTPIQVLAIPRLLNGDANVIAKARTGTGKTAAYGLPLVQELREPREKPRALVLVPTRELALQVASEIESFKEGTHPRITTVYGGASIVEQLRNLKRGCEIVAGTPGRVIDHLERGSLNLDSIEYFILDEADEMLNMGFIEDIETIFKKANPDSRVLMFSATMPKQILKIAADFMGEYEIVEEEASEEPLPLTEQFFWMVREEDKSEALVRLIDTAENFYGLVFCQTKVDADAVAKELDERHYEAAALHGDIPQGQREKILSRFRAGKTRILVATDVAARGIDIEGITHVVNYSIPYDGPTYTHRIGRTGRAGAKGTAVSFIRPNERRRIDYLRRHARGELQEGKIPSIEKVLAQKQERLFSDLRRQLDTIRAEHTVNKPFIELARELLAGNKASLTATEETATVSYAENTESSIINIDSVEVLAAVLQLHYGSVLSASHYRNIKVPRTEDKRGKSSGGNTVRLYIGLGRKDGTSKRSLAQFFSTLLSIPEHAVDRIELFDRFSLADLPADAAHEALRLSKKKNNMPHIHIDTKSDSVNEKSPHTAGYAKKSPSRKLREGNRREAFFRDKDTRKKHPVSASSASAYKKRK
ncbi:MULTISPECIES: DEAD/DEAH box helicase [unclassified Treponema]|uniref:DEAD/DEAH box helicase n=1 Tax=unclassified Treponema TaxID=2638727 RepID=UPI00053014B2|nr:MULTISPECIES: DEAD/DEAH box helicase [unclassified Treponema]AIW89478.1 DEAD/DEAH box helicase [Treponema sp. OMZ 838]UTC50486.1 DEAD/DEAH box helicase [Treponema sp. OMZ 855]